MLKVRFVTLCLIGLAIVWLGGEIPRADARSAISTTPIVKVRYHYYPVSGATPQQVRSQMSQRGPIDRHSGSRFDANTDWKVRWTFHYSQKGKQCQIDSARGTIDVLFTMPKWNRPARVEQALISQWNDYYAALKTHENGHKANGIAAIREVLQNLSTLPAYSGCDQLEVAANTLAQQVVKTYNQQDIEYDRLTHHGFTQGAVFPSISTVSR